MSELREEKRKMPKTKSAKKALRKSLKRREINLQRKRKIKIAVKNFLKAIKEKNIDLAKEKLSLVYKELDKAGKRFIHKNKVARLKAKYSKILDSLAK